MRFIQFFCENSMESWHCNIPEVINSIENGKLSSGPNLKHSYTMTPFDGSGKEAFWKHCGKRRNCLYKQFLLFTQCFLLYQTEIIIFVTFNMSSANALNLVCSKILSCGYGLKHWQTKMYMWLIN